MELNFIADKVITQGVNVEIQGVEVEQVIDAVGPSVIIEGLIHKVGATALIDMIIEQRGDDADN